MGEDLFLNRVDTSRKIADPVDDWKTRPAKAENPPAESSPEATPKSADNDSKTAWQVSSEVTGIIESLTGSNKELSIVRDPETKAIIVKVLDSTTGEVIRLMPLPYPIHGREDPAELRGLLLDVME